MTDPIMMEVLRNRFASIVEEMAVVTLRTGFTVFVKETADFGACLVTPQGEVFAAPTETALSFMVGLPARHAIESIGDYAEGDICISNDPEATRGMATHLPDIWTWKPLFVDGELIAFAFNFINATDIGGSVPGSLSPSNADIYQEGLRIPPTKLSRAGQLNDELITIIRANSRVPEDNWGDLKAQMASLNTAQRRFTDCVARYGLSTVRSGISALLDQSEQRARQVLQRIPNGSWSFVDYIEADHVGSRPIRIKLNLTCTDGDLTLDFTGTDLEVRAAFNLPSWSQRGHYMICIPLLNYIRSVDPTIAYNSGMVRNVDLRIPAETVLNPSPTAAVGVRGVTMIRVFDCILGCLSQALPTVFPAAGSGIISIVVLSTVDPATGKTHVSVAQPLIGGSGARPDKDGIDGSSFTGGWLRNIPNEVLEAESPVLVEQYGYRTRHAGAGCTRGGLGVAFRIRLLGPDTVMTARGLDRFRFRPWGVRGGRPGALSRVTVNPGKHNEYDAGKLDVLRLAAGDVVQFESSSGAGYGDPLDRRPADVLTDVQLGLITAQDALDAYGVVIRDGRLDRTATVTERSGRPAAADVMVFGEERADYDRRRPDAVQDAVIRHLREYPRALRPALRAQLDAMLDSALAFGGPVEPDEVRTLLGLAHTEMLSAATSGYAAGEVDR